MAYRTRIAAIARFLLGALALWLGKFLTKLIAPVIALPCFVRIAEESDVTGFPSEYPNTPREFLAPWLMWAQTHDAPLDEYFVGRYYEGKWTERFKSNKWLMRMCWLWRNPAYGLSESLGLEQPMIQLTERTNNNWRKPITSYEYWTATNSKGQWGFMLRGQIKVWGKRYMEYRLGYGLYRDSPKKHKAMLYARILKFRKY